MRVRGRAVRQWVMPLVVYSASCLNWSSDGYFWLSLNLCSYRQAQHTLCTRLAWTRSNLQRDRDCARPGHICAGTALAPATSAPGLRSPLPHLRRDSAHLLLERRKVEEPVPEAADKPRAEHISHEDRDHPIRGERSGPAKGRVVSRGESCPWAARASRVHTKTEE